MLSLKSKLILGVLGIVIIILIKLSNIEYIDYNKVKCNLEEEMKKKSFYGKVIGVFQDRKNHMSPTLLLDNDLFKINLSNEKSGFKDLLKKDDYVEKKRGTLVVSIVRDSNSFEVVLDYECELNKD